MGIAFAVHGAKPPLLRATNRVPPSYGPTAANVADAPLVREPLAGPASARARSRGGSRRTSGLPRRRARGELAERGILPATEEADRRPPIRQRAKVRFAALERAFGTDGTPAKTLTGPVARVAAKVVPTPAAAATQTGCSVVPKAASRGRGPDALAMLIQGAVPARWGRTAGGRRKGRRPHGGRARVLPGGAHTGSNAILGSL